jgi:hypothetical protein
MTGPLASALRPARNSAGAVETPLRAPAPPAAQCDAPLLWMEFKAGARRGAGAQAGPDALPLRGSRRAEGPVGSAAPLGRPPAPPPAAPRPTTPPRALLPHPERPNQDVHITAGVPAAPGLAGLRPGIALFGPGLPAYDASKLGCEWVVRGAPTR